MKKFVLEFFFRGLVACGFGPVVLAVLYLILQQSANLERLTVNEVCIGIFSLTALAFIAGGMNAVYKIERLNGSSFNTRRYSIHQLFGYLSAQQLAGVGRNSNPGFFWYFYCWISDHLGDHICYNQEKHREAQRNTKEAAKCRRYDTLNRLQI